MAKNKITKNWIFKTQKIIKIKTCNIPRNIINNLQKHTIQMQISKKSLFKKTLKPFPKTDFFETQKLQKSK